MPSDESPRRVLLAEDAKTLMVAIRDFLEDEDFEVEAVADAAGVREHGPTVNVLVVDVRLPTRAMEGIEAVASLIKASKIDKHVPEDVKKKAGGLLDRFKKK